MRGIALAGVVGLLVLAPPAVAGELRAGAAVVDATYHVGPSAGQYAHPRGETVAGAVLDQEVPDPSEIDDPAAEFGEFDPFLQQTKNQPSYGVQSRLTTRAVVVHEAGGQKVAIVKTDLYIPQDMLRRRAVQLLARGSSGIGTHNLVFTVSHNHSSPYYTSTAWGAWAFQDVFDVRHWDYAARTIARAVEQAAAATVPVRMTAGQVAFDKLARHSFGLARADDGTPAGYPVSETDPALSVVRFDAQSTGKPVAVLANWSVHPEFLDGNGLISADYLGPLERFVDREIGAPLIWTQRAVGTAEPERSTYHDVHERLEFTHREYGQAEFGARLLADALIGLHRDLGAQGPRTRVGWTGDAPLRVDDRWFPGPLSHPVPTVSNCRTDTALGGDPQLPIVGLPDCTSLPVVEDLGVDPGLSTAQLGALGIPLPSNYSFPSYSGLQETLGVHLQVVRIGDLVLPVCSCEQWYDQARNIETRLNRTPDDEWLGYDWSAQCTPAGDGKWTCPNAANPVSDEAFRRMRAQVRNPANGWNDPVAGEPGRGLLAEVEPPDPDDILGNYTHDDTDDHGCREDLSDRDAPCVQTQSYADRHGYDLVVPIAMGNDYNGYIATYREYQRGDHYRKALTAFGPHSSDYLATRLVDMGHALKGDGAARARLDAEPLAAKDVADQAHADVKAATLGAVAETGIPAYEALLPDDAGPPAVLAQPAAVVERFGAVAVRWRGGSNYTDDPEVVVERRRADGSWERYADGSGEVPVTVKYPEIAETFSFLAATYSWEWTATFEAFVARIETTRPDGSRERATPAGTYRFRIRGRSRASRAARAYELTSAPFEVRAWRGITVGDLRRDADGRASVKLGPAGDRSGTDMRDGATRIGPVGPIDYPDSYAGGPRFIDPARGVVRDPAAPDDPTRWEWYCEACSFRPWLDAGDAQSVTFQVSSATGCTMVAGERAGDRWRTARPLAAGETARVAPGGVVDPYGNTNGTATGPPLPGCPADLPPPSTPSGGGTAAAPKTCINLLGLVRVC